MRMIILALVLLFTATPAFSQFMTNLSVKGDLKLPAEQSQSAMYIDATGKIRGSTDVSSTELSFLDGVTSAVQTQIDTKATPGDISSAISTHDADTSTHGVGVVVGTTESQTLTNKILTSPVINTPTGITKSDIGLSNVDNTSDATKNSALATLTNKTLTSPTINSPIGIVKSDVGLGSVDNTSDATKNAASVTLTNKTLTSPVINTPTGILKGDVGLGSVDNTSDATKNSAAVTLTNKTITGASIQSPTRLDPKKDTYANLVTYASTAQSGEIVYSTDTNVMYKVVSGALSAMGGSGGISNWITATAYVLNDVVIESGKIYQCSTAHTSGTFATDLAANKWTEISNTLSLKAQNGSSVSATELQFPNDQLTLTATGKYLHNSGNKNILSNGGFEHSTVLTSWTLTSGSSVAETTTKIDGEKSLKVTLSAQALVLYQESTRHASQFADGVQGIASVRVKTAVSGLKVCARQAGALTTICADVSSDGKWGLYKVPYIFGATSNGISINSNSVAVTGDVYVDDAYVGTDAGIADVSVITPWQSYSATTTGFGTTTPASPTLYWRQVGSSIEVVGSWTNGTVAASLASISLPNGYTLDSSKLTRANTTAQEGNIVGNYAGNGSSSIRGSIVTATATSTSLVYFGNLTATSSILVPQNGSGIGFTGGVLAIGFTVPISQLSGSTQVFASQCGASCENVLSSKISAAAGTVTDENVDFINGNCTNASPSVCTFNTGIFSVAPNCIVTAVASAGNDWVAKVVSTSSTTVSVQTNTDASFTTNPFNLICQKQGADYQSSRTIVGSFKEVITAPGITKPKTCYAAYGGAAATLAAPVNCTTGTCIEVFDSCGAFLAPAFSTTGQYTNFTVANGTFANSSYVDCTCSAFDTTTGNARLCTTYWETGDQNWSSNSSGGFVGNVLTWLTSAANTHFKIQCTGQAP